MRKSNNLTLLLSIFALGCLILILSVYFVCHVYLSKVSSESIQNWLLSEKVEIQEGNLLQAIMKNQRVLTSSEFIKGVTLIDVTQEKQNILITLGKEIDVNKLRQKSSEIEVVDNGFFKQIAVASIPGNPNLSLGFLIDAEFLRIIFLLMSSGLVLLFCLFSVTVYALVKVESNRREKLILDQAKGKQVFADLASRVAHDIRSPMAVLSRISSSQLSDEEVRSIVNQVVGRLQSITDDLINYWRFELNGKSEYQDIRVISEDLESLTKLTQSLIAEKSNLYSHLSGVLFNFKTVNSGAEFKVSPEFARHLSNIIDNSVEAVGLSGTISVALHDSDSSVNLVVEDTGCGISEEVLSILGKRKISFGKSDGAGQGVFYASLFMQSIGGSLKVESTQGIGSKFSFLFPKEKNVLRIIKGFPVAYVDDDNIFHANGLEFFRQKLGLSTEINLFKNTEEYLRWASSAPPHVLFSDFDLREGSMNGLDLIERVRSTGQAALTFLITNSYDDSSMLQRAKTLGTPVLAKDKLKKYSFF